MQAGSKDIRRSAVGVVTGIVDELIIEGEPGRGSQRVAVIGLENLLGAVVGQLPVANQDAEPAGVEERDMRVADAVDDAGDADRVVRPSP